MLVDVGWVSGDIWQLRQIMQVLIRYEKYDQQVHIQIYCIINREKWPQYVADTCSRICCL